jgi:hypothetical protein
MRGVDGMVRTQGLDPAWRVQDEAQRPFHPDTVAMAVTREYAAYTAPGVAKLIPKTRAELKAALAAHQQEIVRLRRCLQGISRCATCEACRGAVWITLSEAPNLDLAWREGVCGRGQPRAV